MNRRQALQLFAGSSALLMSGCNSLGEDPGPFNFAIVNGREQSYFAEFTVQDDDREILIDGSVDIAASPPGDGEETVLNFDKLTQVTNGDSINVQIQVAGETYEETYEVTCNQSENAQNNFFFRIRHPEAPSSSETGMEFSGSEC
jgi:hypothetical protein